MKPALDSSAPQAPPKTQPKPAIDLEPADANAPSPREEKSGDPDVEPELPVVKRGKLKTVIELKVRPVEEEKPPTGLSTVPSDAEAAKRIEIAYEAVQRHELTKAERELDEARAMNHEQAWLWTTYGYLDETNHQLSVAIEDFQRELTLHPDTYSTYGSLATALRAQKHPEAARVALEQWVGAQPDSLEPVKALLGMLLAESEFSGAVRVGEAAATRLPDKSRNDEVFRFQLGDAQMKAGLTEKAHAALLAVLKTTTDPERKMGSAYDLANAGLELPLAEAKVKEALARQTEESRSWKLEGATQDLLAKTRALAATWDTMGWILFREGKAEEARSYVHAAALSTQSATVLEHLGDIEAAQGKAEEAAHNYELALATFPRNDEMETRETPNVKEKALQAKIDKNRKGQRPATQLELAQALRQLRTVRVGSVRAMEGTQNFRLLLRGGRVTEAVTIGDKELAGGETKVKQAIVAAFWPEGSNASLVRQGELNCHDGECDLVLEP